MFEVRNPATGQWIEGFPLDDAPTVEARLAAASAAFSLWSRTSLAERVGVIERASGLLRARREDLARRMTIEMGKPIEAARAEVDKCAWVCAWYAAEAAGILAPVAVRAPDLRAEVRHDPLGVVLAIMPWNFPLWQVIRFAAPALLAGNAALLKHAPNVPWSSSAIVEVLRAAGLPPGVFDELRIDVRTTGRVIGDRRVHAVTCTGSERAGRSVGQLAGRHLKKSVLELGGSDPFVVLPGADVGEAAEAAARSRMINNGQSCIAAKRFVVPRAQRGAFVEALVARMSAVRMGDPLDAANGLGPMAREDLRASLHRQVRRSVRAGARLVVGGEVPAGEGWFYPATVLDGCAPGMAAFDEETFGPVAAVAVYDTVEEAVALANATRFGLGATLWGDPDEAVALASRMQAGHVAIRDIVRSDPRLPFGGVRDSGWGRELGRWGMHEFVNIRTVVIGGG